MRPSSTSITPPCPCRVTRYPSMNGIRSTGSSSREGIRTGRWAESGERSATRAEGLADRVEANVAAASTSVPPAVASEEIVTQSAKGSSRRSGLPDQRRAVDFADVLMSAEREREIKLGQQATQDVLNAALPVDRQPPRIGPAHAGAVGAQRQRLEDVRARAHAAVEEHGQLRPHGLAHRGQGVQRADRAIDLAPAVV